MVAGHSHAAYNFAGSVAPLVFTCFIPTLMPFGLGVFIVLLRISEKSNRKFLWTAVFKALQQQIYGDQLAKTESGVYTLYNRKIRKRILAALFLAEIVILLCVAVSFWSEFLIEQGNQCDSGYDCFALLNE